MDKGSVRKEVHDWAGLAQALADHPLPGADDDMDLNMTELASVLTVSLPSVKSWLNKADDPMPYVEQGGNGREYVLRLSWCYAWREKQKAEREGRDARLVQLQAQLAGLDTSDAEQGLTAKQVREVAEARIKHAEAARMLGTLTEMDGVYRLIEAIFVILRNTAMGAGDRLERELNLTPAQTRVVERLMEEMLTSASDTIADSVIGQDYTANLDMSRQLVNHT